nr:hypothetical protein [Tanacetum cinerariifolium]
MTEGNKKQYIVDVKVMNYLLQAILNDIYNSVDACKNAKDMWEQIKRLMYGSNYQGELQGDSLENKLTTSMMLLARAITQKFSIPTNNHLRTSSNTRNQAVIQDGRVGIQTKNAVDNNADSEPPYDAKAGSEDPYVENNDGTSEHDSNAHDEYHDIQMMAYNVQRDA